MLGKFIVLEGPDGAGTTTQSKLLADALQALGHDVLLTAEPSNGPIGSFVRSQLQAKTLPSPTAIQLAFCADRAWHVDTVITPALAQGKVVICDRYVTSTIIYGEASGVDVQWLRRINDSFPSPDLEIFTLVPFAVGYARVSKRAAQDAFEIKAFQEKIYNLYKRFALDNPQIHGIDTSKDKDEAHKSALGLALSVLKG